MEETEIDIFPVAWCDDAAMQGLVGNVASDAAKHYFERSNWSDREMAERLNNPLYGGAYVEIIIKQNAIYKKALEEYANGSSNFARAMAALEYDELFAGANNGN